MFFVSIRFSNLILKIGLATVFLWFGIHKFIDPGYWVNAWIPSWFPGVLSVLSLTTTNFIYILGIFEILVGLSFVTGVGVRLFAFLGSLFLLITLFTFGLGGFNEIVVRDIGLLAGLLALVFWPEQARL